MDLLRSEILKAWTSLAVRCTVSAATLVPPALAFMTGLFFRPTDRRWEGFPIESHGFEVAGFGQPLVILLAALLVGNEFSAGELRTSLTATPRRTRLLVAKLAVVIGSAACIAVVATSAAVLLKHAALGPYGLPVSEFTVGMAWNLAGVTADYVLIAVIAASVTLLARSAVVTLVVLVPMVLGLTIGLLPAIPALRYLPDLAGVQLLTSYPGVGLLEPIPGACVMGAWAVGLAGIAAVVVARRDVGG